MATIASPTGTALIPTQGSWRPLVDIVVSFNFVLIVFFGDNIELVGYTTNLVINSWPVVIPPRTPPLLFERNKGFLFLILISSTLEIPDS